MVLLYKSYISDIDECTSINGGCEDMCINNPGSFDCACGNGYELDTGNTTCKGKFTTYVQVFFKKGCEADSQFASKIY